MGEVINLTVKRFEPTDKRLGRHVVHDSRSLRYPMRAASDPRKLTPIQHSINIAIMDQGEVGSCTGHAGTYTLASDAFWRAGQAALGSDPHRFAEGLYSDATKLDPWEGEWTPTDTGSDGLSIAKVLLARGLISGYKHALSLEAVLTALSEQVVMVGTTWMSGMYQPQPDGRLRLTGNAVGGHEYVLDELDVKNQRVWMRNQWGNEWGLQGRAYLTWGDLAKLLADFGDCTILVPKTEPPPEPVPVPAVPTELAALSESLTRFMRTTSVPRYVRTPAEAWLKSLKSK